MDSVNAWPGPGAGLRWVSGEALRRVPRQLAKAASTAAVRSANSWLGSTDINRRRWCAPARVTQMSADEAGDEVLRIGARSATASVADASARATCADVSVVGLSAQCRRSGRPMWRCGGRSQCSTPRAWRGRWHCGRCVSPLGAGLSRRPPRATSACTGAGARTVRVRREIFGSYLCVSERSVAPRTLFRAHRICGCRGCWWRW
jgi:hypothetical protein